VPMSLNQFDRTVLLFNLHVEMVPKGAEPQPLITMQRAMQMIVEAWRAGDAKMRVGDRIEEPGDDGREEGGPAEGAQPTEKPNLLQIKDVDWTDDGIVTILLSHGDARAADPALLNFSTNKLRTAGKTDADGLAHAAHLVITTEKPLLTKSGQSRALLKRTPNVGRSLIVSFFNLLLRGEAAKHRLSFKDVDNKNKRCHPKLVSHSQPSHEFRDDIINGKLTGVEFITRHVGPGLDGRDGVEPETKTLKYKLRKPPTGIAALDLVVELTEWARKNNFDKIQINFVSAHTRKPESARFRTDIEDARELIYSKSEPIGDFSHRLVQHPQAIVPEIQVKMAELLHKEVAWR
jgi:hypothetical protein